MGDNIGCNCVYTARLLLWVPEIIVVGEVPDKWNGGGWELSFEDSMSSVTKFLNKSEHELNCYITLNSPFWTYIFVSHIVTWRLELLDLRSGLIDSTVAIGSFDDGDGSDRITLRSCIIMLYI